MAEPPFQMAGHWWDPEKKRFFKIHPGLPAPKPTSTASGSSKVAGGRKGLKGKAGEQELPADRHYARTSRLPAIRLQSPVSRPAKHPSPFPAPIIDPTSMQQQGRSPLTTLSLLARPRIEAAYSHLALCRAMKPWPQRQDQHDIIAFQTDMDNQSLLILTGVAGKQTESILRLPQLFGAVDILHTSERPIAPVLLRSRNILFHSPFVNEGYYEQLPYLRLWSPVRDNFPFRPRPRPPATGMFPDYPEISRSTAFPDPIAVHELCSWALYEIPPPKTAEKQTLGVPEKEDGKIIIAISNCKYIYVFHTQPPGMYLSGEPKKYWLGDSDCMALTFSYSGEKLYCGLRSGGVVEMPWDQPKGVMPQFRYLAKEDAGSVTQLKMLSEGELLVVRINGVVEMIDTMTGETITRYEGHVNSYQYGLGFAVDPDLRLMALAGLDRRVRVWSLQSSIPLGTTATTLAPKNFCKDSEVNLWDQSHLPAFREAHPPPENAESGTAAVRKGSTLSTTVFPADIKALHWNPRSIWEGCDRDEAIAIEQLQEETRGRGVPEKRWKDLYVGAGEWVYQFRWP
ncbi:hypothetical protein NDA18_005936 [Ustilago nuda]|nr:hypothetical protein NDA18_005936 [Ustilago nuda]